MLPRERGFSLLELLIVIVIIGIAVAWVAPRFGRSEVSLLKAELREAIATLNYARRMALIQGIKTNVVLSSMPKDLSGQGQKSDELHWRSRGAELRWAEQRGETAQKDEKTAPAFVFTFYPGGGSSGGELILSRAEYRATIEVNPLTGKISAAMEEN